MCNRRLKSTFFEIFSSLRLQVSLGLSPLCWKTIQNMLILVFEANSMASLNYMYFFRIFDLYVLLQLLQYCRFWPTRNILTYKRILRMFSKNVALFSYLKALFGQKMLEFHISCAWHIKYTMLC